MSGNAGGTEKTYNVTDEDVRNVEAQEAKVRGGENPSTSDSAALKSSILAAVYPLPANRHICQSMMADRGESKQETIDRAQANLPLPDQPPAASDFNSADARTVNVGSGGLSEDVSTGAYGGSESGLREPATAASSARVAGDQLKTDTKP
ncbi:MAG: hypothetical protein Q9227_006964 [Pyrenula ochraceoflavens]